MVVLALMLVALGVVIYYTEGEHQEVGFPPTGLQLVIRT